MAFEWSRAAEKGGPPAGLERVLGHDAATWRQWRAWAHEESALAGLDTDRLRGELAAGDQARKDALLLALVRLAHAGPHADAALLVLAQCLLPGLRHRLGRLAMSLDRDDAFSVMVCALIERVRAYPAAERTEFVATYLLETPTRRLRRIRDTEQAWASHVRSVPHSPDVAGLPADTILGLAVTAGVLSAADAWLIWVTRAGALTLLQAARRLGLSYDATCKRRQRAEHRWANWWVPDHPARCRDGRGRP